MNSDNPAPIHQSIIYPKIQRKRLESYKFTLFCWFLTLGIWISIILLFTIYLPKPKIDKETFYEIFEFFPIKQNLKKIYLAFFLLFYIIYIIAEIFSSMFIYLCNKSKKKFKDKINSLFNKPPILKLESQLKIDESNGSGYQKINENFKFISTKDISGLFILNSNKNELDKKKFVFLELKQEISFFDEETSAKYLKFKKDFIEKCKGRDKSCKIKEEIKIKDLKNKYMLRIGDEKDSIFVNKVIFVFLTFISLAELYKIYINYISIYQKFTIRKIISSKVDLNREMSLNKYTPLIDMIESNIFISQSGQSRQICNSNNKIVINNDEKLQSGGTIDEISGEIPNPYAISKKSNKD